MIRIKTDLIFASITFLLSVSQVKTDLATDDLNVPCSYHDTVDLKNSIKFENGSYLHDGIVIPSHLVGIYNYHLPTVLERVSAKSHVRGCICKIRTCLRWCCKPGQTLLDEGCDNVNRKVETVITFIGNDGENMTEDIYKHFYPLDERKPQADMYALTPTHPLYTYDEWTLYQNGSILSDEKWYSKDQFCLAANLIYNDTEYEITAYLPFSNDQISSTDIVYGYGLFISIPFMIITIAIYICIPELRNLHGKSLICYLIGLVIGYSFLSYLLITGGQALSQTECTIFGYFTYFSFMSAFLWLSVISFDLWWNFRGIQGRNRLKDKRRFIYYSLYAWGIAALFLVVSILAQHSNLPDRYKPKIGEQHCWFAIQDDWSAMIYFFGPILILISFNTAVFIMTSAKIYRVQRECAKIIAREENYRNLSSEKDQFCHFLRLFVIMGVTWSMEILSYCVGPRSAVFYITDICNAIQGFSIFALFVLKVKVKSLILKRFRKKHNSGSSSSKGNSCDLTLTPLNHTTISQDLTRDS